MFGLLNIDKPAGPTSHDVVARIRRMLPRKTKVGHAGTLDPFASGVLVICVGPATRLADYVADGAKQYDAEVTFGVTSTTDDPMGALSPTGAPPPDEPRLRAALSEFVGAIAQTPPAHSAVHVNGRRAYDLARRNEPVELPARPVQVDRIELLDMRGAVVRLRIDCGKGTYIRALARDLGRRLGCGGYCSSLRRTRVGPFGIADAIAPDALGPADVADHLQPARLAVASWPTVTLNGEAVAALHCGRTVPHRGPTEQGAVPIAALDDQGRLVALCVADPAAGVLRPKKVF